MNVDLVAGGVPLSTLLVTLLATLLVTVVWLQGRSASELKSLREGVAARDADIATLRERVAARDADIVRMRDDAATVFGHKKDKIKVLKEQLTKANQRVARLRTDKDALITASETLSAALDSTTLAQTTPHRPRASHTSTGLLASRSRVLKSDLEACKDLAAAAVTKLHGLPQPVYEKDMYAPLVQLFSGVVSALFPGQPGTPEGYFTTLLVENVSSKVLFTRDLDLRSVDCKIDIGIFAGDTVSVDSLIMIIEVKREQNLPQLIEDGQVQLLDYLQAVGSRRLQPTMRGLLIGWQHVISAKVERNAAADTVRKVNQAMLWSSSDVGPRIADYVLKACNEYKEHRDVRFPRIDASLAKLRTLWSNTVLPQPVCAAGDSAGPAGGASSSHGSASVAGSVSFDVVHRVVSVTSHSAVALLKHSLRNAFVQPSAIVCKIVLPRFLRESAVRECEVLGLMHASVAEFRARPGFRVVPDAVLAGVCVDSGNDAEWLENVCASLQFPVPRVVASDVTADLPWLACVPLCEQLRANDVNGTLCVQLVATLFVLHTHAQYTHGDVRSANIMKQADLGAQSVGAGTGASDDGDTLYGPKSAVLIDLGCAHRLEERRKFSGAWQTISRRQLELLPPPAHGVPDRERLHAYAIDRLPSDDLSSLVVTAYQMRHATGHLARPRCLADVSNVWANLRADSRWDAALAEAEAVGGGGRDMAVHYVALARKLRDLLPPVDLVACVSSLQIASAGTTVK